MTNLDKYKMTRLERMGYSIKEYFVALPRKFANFFTKTIPNKAKKIANKVKTECQDIGKTFKDGDYATKISFAVMGFGQFTRKQFLRGFFYLAFEVSFILYMVFFGWKWLSLLGSLGEKEMTQITDENGYTYYIEGDNSMLIMLYSLLTIFIIIAFIYVWRANVRDNIITQKYMEISKAPATAKDDIKQLVNGQYHKMLLSIPMGGLLIFKVIPLIFMVMIAFTNWDRINQPPAQLLDWVAFDNFIDLFGGGITSDSALFVNTFKQVLLWTIIWAIFATFTCYFLGMFVAMLINKKGIKLKKLWRTILVFTIAVPSFVSLLLMSQVLQDQGVLNYLLKYFNIIEEHIPFLTNARLAKVTIIIVNIWIGVPYTMLICTGILMNIPEDLYESAKIDGASPVRMYTKITLPYMLFVTGPYLISSFTGNLNNFNVIYFLTAGEPINSDFYYAGSTDLLITWLYKLTVTDSNYRLASVIGIIVFIICAVVSLVFYKRTSAVKNEGDFK